MCYETETDTFFELSRLFVVTFATITAERLVKKLKKKTLITSRRSRRVPMCVLTSEEFSARNKNTNCPDSRRALVDNMNM